MGPNGWRTPSRRSSLTARAAKLRRAAAAHLELSSCEEETGWLGVRALDSEFG